MCGEHLDSRLQSSVSLRSRAFAKEERNKNLRIDAGPAPEYRYVSDPRIDDLADCGTDDPGDCCNSVKSLE